MLVVTVALVVVAYAARRATVVPALYASGDAGPDGTDSVKGATLAVIEVPTTVSGDRLAFFMSGDGGWVVADRRLAEDLAAHGVAVIGLDSRAYLSQRRTPEQVGEDVARTLSAYLSAWHKERILLMGSSRGADIMPFVANRLPDELRSRVDLIAMFSVSRWANFQFHWQDVVFDIRRPTDVPVLPELERLRGTRMLCVYGADEKNSLCGAIDTSLVTPYPRDGGHRLRGDQSSQLSRLILSELTP
jgi:type IV secretory pathway VirJ component